MSNIINLSMATTGLWLLLVSCVFAQKSDVMDQIFAFEDPVNSKNEDIRVGSFIFHPSIIFNRYSDDNIFSTDTAAQNDKITGLNAELAFNSDWDKHLLDLKLGLDINRYDTFKSENTVDNWINAKTQYDINKTSSLALTAGYINDHEDRASPETVFGIEPTEFSEARITASFNKKFNGHSIKIAATSVNLDYSDVTATTGIINNDDRDRADNSIGVRFNYSIQKGYYIFLKSSAENRDYVQAVDSNLFNRDSDIKNNVLGLNFKNHVRFYGEVFAGQLTQDFSDSRFTKINEPDYGARINWHTSDYSKLLFIADRSVEETTLNNSSSYLYDQYLIRFDHNLTQHWSYYLNTTQATADYQLITREDIYNDHAAGINYQLEKGLSFGMDYIVLKRDSTVNNDDYRRNQLYLRVSAQI